MSRHFCQWCSGPCECSNGVKDCQHWKETECIPDSDKTEQMWNEDHSNANES